MLAVIVQPLWNSAYGEACVGTQYTFINLISSALTAVDCVFVSSEGVYKGKGCTVLQSQAVQYQA